MSEETVAWANAQTCGNSTRKAILRMLAVFATPRGRVEYVDMEHMIAVTEASKRTVQRHISDLEKLGLIRRVAQHRKDGGQEKNAVELVGYQHPLGLATGSKNDMDDLFKGGGDKLAPPRDKVSPGDDASDMGGVSDCHPLREDKISSPPSPPKGGHIPPKSDLKVPDGKMTVRGALLPQDWTPPDIASLRETVREMVRQWPAGAYRARCEAFVDHYRAATGRQARSRDWNAKLMTWLIGDHPTMVRAKRSGVPFGDLIKRRPKETGAVIPVEHQEREDANSEKIRAQLRSNLGAMLYEQWFSPAAILIEEHEEGIAVLSVFAPSEFAETWIRERFDAQLREIAEVVTGWGIGMTRYQHMCGDEGETE